MKKQFLMIFVTIVMGMFIVHGTFAEMATPDNAAIDESSSDEPIYEEESFDADLQVDSGNNMILPPDISIEDDVETFGSDLNDLVYTPVNPCRIIDTRNASGSLYGRIGPNTGKQFQVNMSNYSTQGGYSGSCGIPTSFNVSAVAINVISTDQTGNGNIRVIPTGGGLPSATLLNYTPGSNLSNSAVVQSAISYTDDLYIYSSFSATHVVVDIMGYFAAPVRTKPDYNRVYASSTIANGSYGTVYSPYCPSGYEWVSAGTDGISQRVYVVGSGRNGSTQRSFCVYHNLTGSSISIACYAHCLRIPGR